MATKQQLTGLTYQDIVDLPEERRELLDGELFVTPSPATRHQEVVGELYHQLRQERRLLAALDFYARRLKASHEARREQLSQAQPGSSDSLITSEALESALKDLEDSLPPASPTDDSEALSLDDAMAFLRKHTPPA